MSDPKVTLLRPDWQDYTYVFGKRRFFFIGGAPMTVPTAVALVLRRKKDGEGKHMFKVEDLPTIVVPTPQVSVSMTPPVLAGMQNDLGEIYQGSLLECL